MIDGVLVDESQTNNFQETEGEYIWSPKHDANSAKNVTYDNLAHCQVGDVVFGYAYAKISLIG